MREECGIFGIISKDGLVDVTQITYLSLYALQHRGQESAGIAVSDGKKLLVYKDLGLVSEVFNEERLISLEGDCAIGQVRYSINSVNTWENSQPLLAKFKGGIFSLAHNGSLTNLEELKLKLAGKNIQSNSCTDGEIICNLIKTTPQEDIEENLKVVARQLKGAFSMIIMTEDKLIGLKDPFGFRPLALGKMKSSYIFSSETCAFNLIGAQLIRELEPGEIVMIDRESIKSNKIISTNQRRAFCMFEFIYFARPDSNIYGENVALCRQRMGQILAQEYPVEADIVVPIPDSGISAAIGYAIQSGIPYEEGLIKNRYIGRTFIQPGQLIRDLGVRIKLSPLQEILWDKRVVLVDDSIVRGTTIQKIVRLVRQAGAREVHIRISSPPVRWPCFYGIDTPNQKDLWAANHNQEEIRKWLGADTLGYISIEGLCSVFKKISVNDFCLACFNGEYPV